jgi:hypothetical protein
MSSDYGTYRLSFTPPESTGLEDYPNIAIEMSTGGDASVDQMLRFFEAFLAAAGYVLKGDLQVVEQGNRNRYDMWESPYNYVTAGGSQATDFVPFSLADDVINFGSK